MSDTEDVPNLEVEFHSLDKLSPNRSFFIAQAKEKIVEHTIEAKEYNASQNYDDNEYIEPYSVFQYFLQIETLDSYGIDVSSNEKWQGVIRHKGNNKKQKKKEEYEDEEIVYEDDEVSDGSEVSSEDSDKFEPAPKKQKKEKRKVSAIDRNLPVIHVFTERKVTKKSKHYGNRKTDLALFRDNDFSVIYFIIKYVSLCFHFSNFS